jgi:hypothetical protein
LVASTVRAAVSVAGGIRVGSVASGVVASLVHHTVWSMTMIKMGGALAGVLMVGVAGAGVVAWAQVGLGGMRPTAPAAEAVKVGTGDQRAKDDGGGTGLAPRSDATRPKGGIEKVMEHQKLAPAAGLEEGVCRLEGQPAVIKMLRYGTKVKRGDVVCELDASQLEDQLINQRITTNSAEAIFLNAKLAREDAQISVREYKEGILKQDLATIDGEIHLGEEELALAQEELAEAKRDNKARLAAKRAEVNVFRAKLAIEKAQGRREILSTFTQRKMMRTLEAEVSKTHMNELSREATWEFEKVKEEKLKKQIAACRMTAPIDGYVVCRGVKRYETAQSITRFYPDVRIGFTALYGQRLFRVVSAEDWRDKWVNYGNLGTPAEMGHGPVSAPIDDDGD